MSCTAPVNLHRVQCQSRVMLHRGSYPSKREQHVPDSSNHSHCLNTPYIRHQHHTHTHTHRHTHTHCAHATQTRNTQHLHSAHTKHIRHDTRNQHPIHTYISIRTQKTQSSASLGASDLCSCSKHSQDHGRFGHLSIHQRGTHVSQKTRETLAVRERQNMHSGHRSDSTGHHVTRT